MNLWGFADQHYFELARTKIRYGATGTVTKLYLRKFNKKLEFVNETEFNLNPFKDDSYTHEGNLLINGKIYVFSSYWSRKERTITYFYQICNYNATLSQPVALIQVPVEQKIQYVDDLDAIFDQVGSEDHSCFAVIMKQFPKSNFYVFNSELKLKWKKEFDFKPEDLANFAGTIVSNQGGVFNLFKKYNKEKSKDDKKNIMRYDYFGYLFSAENGEFQKIEINPGHGLYPTGIKPYFDEQGVLHIGGDYTDNEDQRIMTGFYFMTNRTGTDKMDRLIKPVDMELFKKFLGYLDTKHKNGDGPAILGGSLLYWRRDAENNIIIVAEKTYKTLSQFQDIGNAVVIKLDPSGNLLWTCVIPKWQTYDFGSVTSSIINGTTYLIYNDNPENIEKIKGNTDGNVEIKKLIENQIASYLLTITPEGKMTCQFLCNRKEGKELNGLIYRGENSLNYLETENCFITHTSMDRLARINIGK